MDLGAVACGVSPKDALGELNEGLVEGVYGGLGSLAENMANDFILGQTFSATLSSGEFNFTQ